MADILNLSFGCGNTLLAGQLNQIVLAINQLANQNGAQRGITLNTNTRELSITNNSSTADLDSILPYGIKDGGSWDDFITFYRDSNNNHEVDINGSGGRQCDLGVTGNIRTGLSNEYSYVRTDILLLKDGRNDSYIGKLYSSNGNLYYLYVDGSGQKTKYYPALLITRAKINLDGDTTGFELNVDIPQNQNNNNNNTIGLAATDSIGGIKLWADGDDPLDTYDYPVKLNYNGSAYVTVNWSNQGTTLAGLMGNNAVGSLSLPIYWSGSGFQACNMDTSGITAIDLPNNLNTTLNNGTVTIPAATNDSYGVVKLGYDNSSNSNRHPVESDNGSGLYVDLSNASVPSIGANDGVGEVLAIIQGADNTKQIGWAQLSPNGVAGVSSIEFGYSSGNTLAFAQAATSNQTLKLVPGDNILLSSDTDHYLNSIKISASLEFQDLSDVPAYDLDGYLKYESGSLIWTNVAPGSPTVSITDGTSSDSNQKTLSANTKYKLTVGENSYVFTTPPAGSGLTGIKYQNYSSNSATTASSSSGYVTLKAETSNVSFDNTTTGVLKISVTGNNGISAATDKAIGGFKTGFSESNSGSDTNRNYAVKLSDGRAYVNVPWSATGLNTGNWANYLNSQQKDTPNLSSGYLYYTSGTDSLSLKSSSPGSGVISITPGTGLLNGAGNLDSITTSGTIEIDPSVVINNVSLASLLDALFVGTNIAITGKYTNENDAFTFVAPKQITSSPENSGSSYYFYVKGTIDGYVNPILFHDGSNGKIKLVTGVGSGQGYYESFPDNSLVNTRVILEKSKPLDHTSSNMIEELLRVTSFFLAENLTAGTDYQLGRDNITKIFNNGLIKYYINYNNSN